MESRSTEILIDTRRTKLFIFIDILSLTGCVVVFCWLLSIWRVGREYEFYSPALWAGSLIVLVWDVFKKIKIHRMVDYDTLGANIRSSPFLSANFLAVAVANWIFRWHILTLEVCSSHLSVVVSKLPETGAMNH